MPPRPESAGIEGSERRHRSLRNLDKLAPQAILWLPLPIFIALVGWQIFGPVPIGLANNNDFSRILGPLRLWTRWEPGGDRHPLFQYFVNDYTIQDPRWDPGIPSSEWLTAAAAKDIGKILLPHGTFKLQLMGLLHAALFVLAVFIFLRSLRNRAWWLRLGCGFALVFIWADIEYVQHFNTAYTDAGALGALAILFAIAVHALLAESDWRFALGFALAGVLLLTVKTQHVTALPVLIAFCVLAGIRASSRRDRFVWLAVPVVLVIATVTMLRRTPQDYRAAPAFTIVFYKIAPLSPDPIGVLSDFHMPADEFRKYIGHYFYEPMVPKEDQSFRKRIVTLVTPGTLASFYLHHPRMLSKVVMYDLRAAAPEVALTSYGHMREEDVKAGRHAFEVKLWSRLRTFLFRIAPNHLLWFFLIATILAIFAIASRGTRAVWFKGATLVLFSVLLAVPSYLFASLLDAAETPRHLLLFHAFTDLAMLSIVLGVALRFESTQPEARRELRLRKPRATLITAAILLLGVIVGPAIPAQPPLRNTGLFDDNAPEIHYFGGWQHGFYPNASHGTTSLSNDSAATVSLSFSGTSLTWVYGKAWNRGIASVTIDGRSQGDVDQYDSSVVWQARNTFDGLPPGKHRIEIRVTGRKREAATDNFIDLDELNPR